MRYPRYILIGVLLPLFSLNLLQAQVLPPIANYPPEVYQAGNQNWMISQDQQSNICIANNEGLLVFNGARWTFYPSENQSILRSVMAIGDRIYTGSYMEFGYWQQNLNGVYQYYSLSQGITDQILQDEQFWNIAASEGTILFQSLSRVYLFDTATQAISLTGSPTGVSKMIELADEIWLQFPGQGIFSLQSAEEATPICIDPRISDKRLANIFPWEDGHLIVTQQDGFYFLKDGLLSPWNTPLTEQLRTATIFRCIQLQNGDLALGTVSQGLIVLDHQGQFKYQVDQSHGLNSNNILTLFEDQTGNLWLGLFSGVNCINPQSPFQSYSDSPGVLGTVYAAAVFQNRLYLGTNQGLFSKPIDTDVEFSIVDNIRGQVWSLTVLDNNLFCGHDAGTYWINEEKAELISSQPGTWKITTVPGKDNLLLQGHYQGFSFLKKTAGRWEFGHLVENYDAFGRFFEISEDLRIITSHVYDGLFEVTLDENLQQTISVKHLDYLPADAFPGLAKLAQNIYYTTEAGTYVLEPGENDFRHDSLISQLGQEHGFFSGHMNVDRFDQLWLFYQNKLTRISPEENQTIKINNFPVETRQFHIMRGYENVAAIDSQHYLIGSTKGYTVINTDRFDAWQQEYPLYINAASVQQLGQASTSLPLQKSELLHYQQNSLQFDFNVPTYDAFQTVYYQFRMLGAMPNWSAWSERAAASFDNLNFGDYQFEVRARIGSVVTTPTTYRFRIARPWYWSYRAIAAYCFIALVSGFVIHSLYRGYYRRQRQKLIAENHKQLELERLKSEQTITQLRNEQLQQDVDNKNKELAASTMSIIKKNEQLIEIRELLKSSSSNPPAGVQKVVKTINRALSDEETWIFFKEAFDTADKDFLNKVQELHPNLSPSELKLCAYLRLNISSKEIATLLNISVRSVEVKRYRLRKKMELTQGENLVNYILKL